MRLDFEDILTFKKMVADFFLEKNHEWKEEEWNRGINIILAYMKMEIYNALKNPSAGYRELLRVDEQFQKAYGILAGQEEIASILDNILSGKI